MQPSAAVPGSVVCGSSRHHHVSDAADGADETGLVDLVAELLAQMDDESLLLKT